MKYRIYQTLDGGVVTMLRPENARELATLEQAYLEDDDQFEARHSLADEREEDDSLDSVDE